ncbi:hypothetical protein C5C45_06340 [Rathayibacter rathayi]|uniref:hypothetical protein n=1 Tax=Rathayibacter rathayi TaxID=33887 RepID=UPI000CE793CC|nr:hypothetical protein [Rathayibacter rathayi]PPH69245.1 hypothetical protein C5C45_06340 [Rathayibacter rathayi]PPI69268.1 hypothetical protein C5E12_10740 [Rathayibacter rathayi]
MHLVPAVTEQECEHAGQQRTWFQDDGASEHQQQTRPLTLASLSWFTDSISTSLRPYWEYATGRTTRVGRVTVPTAVAVVPFDLVHPPRS